MSAASAILVKTRAKIEIKKRIMKDFGARKEGRKE
jgi:hypothetical protein